MQLQVLEADRTDRRRRNEQAWLDYVRDGAEPGGIRPEIVRAWHRARDGYGIDPALLAPRRVLSAEELKQRQRLDEGLLLSAPVFEEIAGQLADHVIAYFDAEGWMLGIGGDPHVVGRLAEIHFRPGVNWSEDSAGTNGPGTCLAERAPFLVEAAEHFVAAWQPFSCAAAPILAHGGPAPLGAIDVTAPWERHSRRAITLAKAVALAVQERLQAATRVREEVVRYALRAAHDAGDALVAVDAAGKVLGLNDAATRRGMVSAGGLAGPVRELLAGPRTALALAADGEARLSLPEGAPLVIAPVRYEGVQVGAILRAEPPASPQRPRPRPRSSARYEFDRILGGSEAIRRVIELGRTAARNDLPVVISGESGTGKEMIAHSIHGASARAAGRFVVVNCGAIPDTLIEAELFGYEAGSFTGARPGGASGRFEDADGGTLFLDEVSELTAQAQLALLRLLQEREVVRLGSSTPRQVSARVVAATNKPLDDEVRAGRFRRDLYYRLNVLPIAVPPLRERGDDVGLLAGCFAAEAAVEIGRPGVTLSADALEALQRHDWPGNVRELRNVVLRAAATAPGTTVRAGDLLFDRRDPARPEARAPGPPGGGPTLRDALLSQEHARLVEAVEASGWNLARAAQRLAVSRTTLYRLLHKYGIDRPPHVPEA